VPALEGGACLNGGGCGGVEGGSLGGLVEEDAKKGLLLLSYVGRLLMSCWLRKSLLEFHKVYTIYGGPQQEGFRPRV
jgi:hypothetical protein